MKPLSALTQSVRLVSGAALLSLLANTLPAQAQNAPQLNLPRAKLSAGMHLIDTQLAMTGEQRQIGLMFRKDMPQHEGMLFEAIVANPPFSAKWSVLSALCSS